MTTQGRPSATRVGRARSGDLGLDVLSLGVQVEPGGALTDVLEADPRHRRWFGQGGEHHRLRDDLCPGPDLLRVVTDAPSAAFPATRDFWAAALLARLVCLYRVDMSSAWLSDTRRSYDEDAPGYAEKVDGLLAEQPYLRGCLALFAESVQRAGGGPVADVGCGPGYVTRHLHDLGVEAFGIDLSSELIAIAKRDHPDLRFEVGTMTDLDLETGSVAGVLAFWSVIHVPDHAVPGVFAEFRRVLRPRGPLLVGFHVGDDVEHSSEGYTGRPVAIDTHRRQPGEVEGWLRDAGFTIEATLVMRPDGDRPGAVVFATRGSSSTPAGVGTSGSPA